MIASSPHTRFRGVVPPVMQGAVRPFWSVMIPTFNCAGLLELCLSSVLAADIPPEQMQIEVVDDASTADDPEAVVRRLGNGRVQFFRQPENLGHARNFNTCLQRSRGQVVHILHGDDWVARGFYASMGALFEAEPEIGAAFSRHTVTNNDGSLQRLSPLERDTPGVLENWLALIAAELRLQPPSIAVRREVYERLGGFDMRMKSCGEDWEMWVRIAASYPVGYHPDLLAFYRDNAGSLTKRSIRSGQNIRDVRMATRIVRSDLAGGPAAAAADRARRNWAGWAMHWAYQLAGRDDYRAAAVQLREAVLCDPSPATLREVARFGQYAAGVVWDRVRSAAAKVLKVHA